MLSSGIMPFVFNMSSNAMRHLAFSTAARPFAAFSVSVAICLVGCSRPATTGQRAVPARPVAALTTPLRVEPAVEAPSIDKARAAELMQAIFGDNYHVDDGAALAVVENGEDAGYWRMTLHAAKARRSADAAAWRAVSSNRLPNRLPK